MLRGVPDQLRIGTNAPNERVPLARLIFLKKWSARAIRKNVKMKILIFLRCQALRWPDRRLSFRGLHGIMEIKDGDRNVDIVNARETFDQYKVAQ